MTCHSRCRIIKHTQHHIRVIVNRIYNACHTRREECRVADKAEAYAVIIRPMEALRHSNARTHAKTGVDHIKRHCVSERITADISAKISLSALHSLLYRIE